MNTRSRNPSDPLWDTEDDDDALRRHREFATMIDSGIFQLDLSGHFVAVNDAMVEMTGYSRQTLLGEHFSVLFSNSDVSYIEREDPPPDAVTTVKIRLYHTQLPKLAELGLVTYDTDEGVVSATDSQ